MNIRSCRAACKAAGASVGSPPAHGLEVKGPATWGAASRAHAATERGRGHRARPAPKPSPLAPSLALGGGGTQKPKAPDTPPSVPDGGTRLGAPRSQETNSFSPRRRCEQPLGDPRAASPWRKRPWSPGHRLCHRLCPEPPASPHVPPRSAGRGLAVPALRLPHLQVCRPRETWVPDGLETETPSRPACPCSCPAAAR